MVISIHRQNIILIILLTIKIHSKQEKERAREHMTHCICVQPEFFSFLFDFKLNLNFMHIFFGNHNIYIYIIGRQNIILVIARNLFFSLHRCCCLFLCYLIIEWNNYTNILSQSIQVFSKWILGQLFVSNVLY